eukprot:620122-Prymnesium_polylepis.2
MTGHRLGREGELKGEQAERDHARAREETAEASQLAHLLTHVTEAPSSRDVRVHNQARPREAAEVRKELLSGRVSVDRGSVVQQICTAVHEKEHQPF